MADNRLRRVRKRRGWTQAELARRAGVSRQLVGAVEAGRNLPRVDAALALAAALDVEAASLFSPTHRPQDVVTGDSPTDGSVLRVGRVGERTVTTAARTQWTGWDVADALLENGQLRPFKPLRPGVVLAGCEPALELLERWLREGGLGAVAASCSSASALVALLDGRTHAAVVHAPAGDLPSPPSDEQVARLGLCSWQVGLAAPPGAKHGWQEEALGGRISVIQREDGAGVQAAFARAAGRRVDGPRAGSHLEAARMAVSSGLPAVTIEPAALVLGASFHALETQVAELWIGRKWLGEPAVDAALTELAGRRFKLRLDAIGGYDLSMCGVSL